MKTHAIRETNAVRPVELFIFIAVFCLMALNLPESFQRFIRSKMRESKNGTEMAEMHNVNEKAYGQTHFLTMPAMVIDRPADVHISDQPVMAAFTYATEILELARVRTEPGLKIESWMTGDEYWEIPAFAKAIQAEASGARGIPAPKPGLIIGPSAMETLLSPAAEPLLELEQWMTQVAAWEPAMFTEKTEDLKVFASRKEFDYQAFFDCVRMNEMLEVEEEKPLKLSAWMQDPGNFEIAGKTETGNDEYCH